MQPYHHTTEHSLLQANGQSDKRRKTERPRRIGARRLRAEQYHFRAHGLRVEERVPDVSALGVIIEVAVDIGKTLRPEQQIHREKAVRARHAGHPVAERTAEHRRRPDQAERRRGMDGRNDALRPQYPAVGEFHARDASAFGVVPFGKKDNILVI